MKDIQSALINTVFDRIYTQKNNPFLSEQTPQAGYTDRGAYAKKLPFAPCDINMDGLPVLLLVVCSNLACIETRVYLIGVQVQCWAALWDWHLTQHLCSKP